MARKAGFDAPPRFRPLHRGDLNVLLLRVLADRPMHGYEIMRILEARFHGLYRPSPGTIYPALAALRKRGHVRARTVGARKAYELTKAGRDHLRTQESHVRQHVREVERRLGPEKAALFHELRDSGHVLMHGLWNLPPAKVRRVKVIVDRFRRELEDLMSGSGSEGERSG